MDQMELYDISEPFMEIINPLRKEQIMHLGDALDLNEEDRIIDFGCGFAEFLTLWAEAHGISGVGIDIREYSIQRARERISGAGVQDRIELVLGSASEYEFEPGSFDHAMCIGASFIWNGFRGMLNGMKGALKPGGKLICGEPYWIKEPVPEKVLAEYPTFFREIDLLRIAREEGFDLEYIIRSDEQGWDLYESTNWLGLNHWLDENPDHPDREQVIEWMRKTQDDYLEFGREYIGFAIYVFRQAQKP